MEMQWRRGRRESSVRGPGIPARSEGAIVQAGTPKRNRPF